MNDLFFLLGTNVVSWIIIILATAFIPYYIRKNIAFGISVPESEQNGEFLKGLRRSYIYSCLLGGLIIALASIISSLNLNIIYSMWIHLGAITIYLLLPVCLYIYNHKKVKKYKLNSDWKIESKTAAVLANEAGTKRVLSSAWYAMYFVIIAFSIFALTLKYPSLPEQIPMHFNIHGEADSFVPKSSASIIALTVIQFLIGLMFAGINISIATSKRQGDFYKDTVFRSVLSKALFVIGLMVMLLFSSIQFAVLGMLNAKLIVILPLILIALILAICVYITVKVGQGGSNLKGKSENTRNAVEDDSHWIGGFIYYNKNDPSIFVEKRFGLGYTLNFGNKISLIVFCAIILFIAALLVLPRLK